MVFVEFPACRVTSVFVDILSGCDGWLLCLCWVVRLWRLTQGLSFCGYCLCNVFAFGGGVNSSVLRPHARLETLFEVRCCAACFQHCWYKSLCGSGVESTFVRFVLLRAFGRLMLRSCVIHPRFVIVLCPCVGVSSATIGC